MVIGPSGVLFSMYSQSDKQKWDDRKVGVQVVNHEGDQRQNWMTQNPDTN